MKIKLIGVGNTGERNLIEIMQYLKKRSMEGFIEDNKVIRAGLNTFHHACQMLSCKLSKGFLSSPKDQVFLRKALAYLLFGGRDADLEKRYKELTSPIERTRRRERKGGESNAPARFFDKIFSHISHQGPEAQDNFLKELKTAFDRHKARIESTAEWLGPDWLIIPETPLDVSNLNIKHANVGHELMESILKVDRNLERLTQGLGTQYSPVDVVAVVFPLGDAFGGEGSELICQSIRQVLMYPDADRIIAILGLGVYDPVSDPIDGRYLGEYLKKDRENRGFDGLIARTDTPGVGEEFGKILAAIAISSDPFRLQIDNPDANQLQRDFGRSLVAVGYGEEVRSQENSSRSSLQELYRAANEDLTSHHCTLDHPYRDTFEEEIECLRKRSRQWQSPDWAECLLQTSQTGLLEKKTAKKVIAYVGHDGRLEGSEIRDLRRIIAKDFPNVPTAVYKYTISEMAFQLGDDSFNPNAFTGKTRLSRLRDRITRVFRSLRRRRSTDMESSHPSNDRLPKHLVLFVVDSFETRAVNRFVRFFETHATIQNGRGEVLRPEGEYEKDDRRLKMIFFSRSLISLPGEPGADWSPEFTDEAKKVFIRSCAEDSILGSVDETFSRRLSMQAAEKIGEGEFSHSQVLDREAEIAEYTVQKADVYLVQEARERLKTAEYFGRVLSGLNWLLNETTYRSRRRVNNSLWQCLKDIEENKK